MTPTEQVFDWLEHTALSMWVHGESMLAFPLILVFHTIGMGFLAGIGAVIALRILGLAPQVPLAILEKFYPVLWFAFAMNAASGVLLFIGYPYKAFTNPVFYVKMFCVALGIYLIVRIRNEVLRAPIMASGQSAAPGASGAIALPRHARLLAILSLVSWAGAILAGRLLAYTYNWLHVGFKGGF